MVTVSLDATTSILTITEVGNGVANITVTADDGNGGAVSDAFSFTVNNANNAPTVANTIAAVTIDEGASTTIDASNVFEDADEADTFTVTVMSSDATIATATIAAATNVITVTGVNDGVVTVTVKATDAGGLSVETTFQVTINNVLSSENESLKEVKLYPNPSLGLVTVESDVNISEIRIYDVLGQLKTLNKYSNVNSIALDLSDFARGSYLIQVIKENGTNKAIWSIKK